MGGEEEGERAKQASGIEKGRNRLSNREKRGKAKSQKEEQDIVD